MKAVEQISSEHPSCMRKGLDSLRANELRNLSCTETNDGGLLVQGYVHSGYKSTRWYHTSIVLSVIPEDWHFSCVCEQRYDLEISPFFLAKFAKT